MKYKDFLNEVKRHLGNYKTSVLEITNNGVFNYRGRIIEYSYIIPFEKDKTREETIKEYNQIECVKGYDFLLANKLHRYAHHLNSSQLMCYNFFRPFVEKEKKVILIELLKKSNITLDSQYDTDCQFEYENPESEWAGEHTGNSNCTNFDFYVGAGGTEVYMEIKYTEQKFGDFKQNEKEIIRHKLKYDEFYKKKIKECPAIKATIKFDEVFRKNYQLIRNIIRVTDSRKYVIFVYDERNENIKRQFESFKAEYICDDYKRNVIGITWQSLYEELKKIDEEHARQFQEKYL